MILIVAGSTDPWATSVYRAARQEGRDALWMGFADLVPECSFANPRAEPIDRSLIVAGCEDIRLQDLTGVFWRPSVDQYPFGDVDANGTDSTEAWSAFLTGLSCTVINPPASTDMGAVEGDNRRWSQSVSNNGFSIAPARSTFSRTEALQQLAEWDGRAYVKPLGSRAPGTLFRRGDSTEALDAVLDRHGLLMRLVPFGHRVTVYAVGDQAVATVIHSIDREGKNLQSCFLPSTQCVELVRSLNLGFAECQFVLTGDGQVYCIDVSPAPNYWHCPPDAKQKIVRRLAASLSAGNNVLHESRETISSTPSSRGGT